MPNARFARRHNLNSTIGWNAYWGDDDTRSRRFRNVRQRQGETSRKRDQRCLRAGKRASIMSLSTGYKRIRLRQIFSPISIPQAGEPTGADLNISDEEEDEDEDLEARIIRDRARVQSGQSTKGGESGIAGNEKARKRIGKTFLF